MYIGFFNYEVNHAIATAIEAKKSNSPEKQSVINSCKSTIVTLWRKEGRTEEDIDSILKTYTF